MRSHQYFLVGNEAMKNSELAWRLTNKNSSFEREPMRRVSELSALAAGPVIVQIWKRVERWNDGFPSPTLWTGVDEWQSVAKMRLARGSFRTDQDSAGGF